MAVNGPLAKLLEVPAYAMPVRFPWAKSSVFLYFVAVGRVPFYYEGFTRN